QGEPMSAMTRIAYNNHAAVQVERGDTVIISAKPIPGNELRVHDAINRLAKMGAEVLHEDNAPVHVSGHGKAEELRTIIGLTRPKAVMPMHGEFRMLAAHAQLARGFGEQAEPLLEELREEANRVLRDLLGDDVTEIKLLQEHLHESLGKVVYARTRRRPMVLPVIVEV